MNRYKNTILILGGFGGILFLIWCFWAYFEVFSPKWNYFCENMITPKHAKFILSQSTQSIMTQCDSVYVSFKNKAHQHHDQNTHSYDDSIVDLFEEHDESKLYVFSGFVILIHFVIISTMSTIAINYRQCVNHTYFTIIYESILITVIIGLVINKLFCDYLSILMMKKIYSYSGFFVG
eukprot:45568_1